MDYNDIKYPKAFAIGSVFGGIIGMIIILFIMILPFWALWNWLMPLFGVPTLTILQSIGLYLLLRIIFFQTTYTHKQ